MHTTSKSVKFLFERASLQCPSIIRYRDTKAQKEHCKNSCFAKNTFESNILHTCHELKLPSKIDITNPADLHNGLRVIQVVVFPFPFCFYFPRIMLSNETKFNFDDKEMCLFGSQNLRGCLKSKFL